MDSKEDKNILQFIYDFVDEYRASGKLFHGPRISLVKANLKGLPPTTIIGAEIDPLQSEGKMLSGKFKNSGVKVNYKLYDGVTHEFFGMATIVPEAKDAQGMAADDLKGGLK